MEMIFIDEQGDTVQASIKYTLLYRFESKIKVNRCYVMSNLTAFFSVKTYKHALNDYRVTFEYTSTVREVDVPSIPIYSFKFTPYADIQQASNNNEYTIDVIGSLLSIGSLNHLSGGTKQNIPFELEDI
ncbi:PREDICTED: replication protein A 70 kDa DNA-binding subunit-like, partial [Erythranthe guttata]|uniref:replication protein A 70 kDa DNA-binding subunit-like n=1 Tax=Erythranthe guttata TaxID=4155 RepID=UPI00064DEB12